MKTAGGMKTTLFRSSLFVWGDLRQDACGMGTL
jgi:hypothetical protein